MLSMGQAYFCHHEMLEKVTPEHMGRKRCISNPTAAAHYRLTLKPLGESGEVAEFRIYYSNDQRFTFFRALDRDSSEWGNTSPACG